MSDRVVVMREGRVRGVFSHDEADPERVMAAAVRRERDSAKDGRR